MVAHEIVYHIKDESALAGRPPIESHVELQQFICEAADRSTAIVAKEGKKRGGHLRQQEKRKVSMLSGDTDEPLLSSRWCCTKLVKLCSRSAPSDARACLLCLCIQGRGAFIRRALCALCWRFYS